MIKLNDVIKNFLIGMGFGSFFLLSIQLLLHPMAEISRNEFLIVMLASGLIGQYAHLFNNEKISFLKAVLVHFTLTLTTVVLVAYFTYHVIRLRTYFIILGIFIIVYALIWLVIQLFTTHEVKEVNKKLEITKKDN